MNIKVTHYNDFICTRTNWDKNSENSDRNSEKGQVDDTQQQIEEVFVISTLGGKNWESEIQ